MKKSFKLFIGILIGTIITGGIVYAATTRADSISYGNGTVKDALDELYQAPTINKFCQYQNSTFADSSNHYSVGTKYRCQVNSTDTYDFYIISTTTNAVRLIMDKNITDFDSTKTMTWSNAMKYIDNNNLKSTWTYALDIDLPTAQDIANATNNSSWKSFESSATWWCFGTKGQDSKSYPYCNANANEAYAWLFNNLSDCSASGCTEGSNSYATGYWTRDKINDSSFWNVHRDGAISYDTVSPGTGVRVVITVLKSNLYETN